MPEIDRHIRQVRRDLDAGFPDTPLLVFLSGRLVHLENSRGFEQFYKSIGPSVEPGAENHDLRYSVANRVFQALLDETRADDHHHRGAKGFHVLASFREVLIERLHDRLIGDHGALLGTEQALGEIVRIADGFVGLAGA